jgi:trimethylamine:corrinoid methyltransferase-like protein
MFAGTEHTLERMRSTMLLTEVADRDRAQWKERGSPIAGPRHAQSRKS